MDTCQENLLKKIIRNVTFIFILSGTCSALLAQEAQVSEDLKQQVDRSALLKTSSCNMPIYSMAVMRKQAQGTVTLSFLIGTDGHVHDVTVSKSSGYRELDDSAAKSLNRCVYEPAIADGKLVEERLSTDYTYSLGP